jgi:serine protease AprX
VIVGRVRRGAIRRCRRATAFAVVAVLLAPLAAQAGKPASPGAFVPGALLAAAGANPDASFNVIVEGTNATKTAAVAGTVADEVAATPGKAKGIGRRFAAVNGVSAELTGKQILKLATRKGVLAIVADASVRLTEAGSPVNVAAPSISGTAQPGETLSATPGDWLGTPDGFAYQWERCTLATLACDSIAGATDPSYAVTADDIGATLRVAVTATNLAGTGSAESDPTGTVVGAVAVVTTPEPTNLVPPAISGSATENATLTADAGTWDGTPLLYGFQWQRCDADGATCADIAGATDAAYTATSLDVGARLRVVVSASNAGGQTSAASTASGVVAPDTSFSSAQLWPYASGVSAFWPDAAAGTRQTPTIAIVDSGIDASRADFGARVVQQVTLTSSTSNSPGDGYGHGTFVASVAAGQAHGHTGAAPDANLVSLDVMDDNGMATLSDVIAAADWIYEHKAEYDIRVANFSLTGSVPTSIQYDPLDKAVERLWLSGVVVVAAAGNYAVDGSQSGVPYAPANDPFVISVGAEDITSDHVAAPWSSFGYTPDGFEKPELGAPGRYMIGAVPPGSTLAAERPAQVVAPGYMELSGTSFAAPVIAGTAAELLAAHPSWTPDQVKGALMVAALPVPAAVPLSLGVGELDAVAARAVAEPPNPNAGLDAFVVPDPAGSPDPVFDTAAWGQAVEGSAAWGQAAWGQAAWGQAAWGQAAWGQAYWSSAAWGQGAALAATDAAAAGSDAVPGRG